MDLQRSPKSQCTLKLPRHELQYYKGLQVHELRCDIDLRSQTGSPCDQDVNCNRILPTRQEFEISLDFPCNQKASSCVVGALEESWTIKFQNLQRLLEAQVEVIRNQSRRLDQCERQIESYETRIHSLRVSQDGANYIQNAYLEPFEQYDEDAVTWKENSTPNTTGGQDASEEVDGGSSTVDGKCASTEVNESCEPRQHAVIRPSLADPSDLLEVEKQLRNKLTKLVAISDENSCQLVQLSDRIAHYDDEIHCKRLQLEDLQEQLDRYDLLPNTDRGTETVSDQPLLLRDPHEQQVQKTHVEDSSARFSRLFLTIVESDTGLSSLGSESSFDLSPADTRHNLNEIPLKHIGNLSRRLICLGV